MSDDSMAGAGVPTVEDEAYRLCLMIEALPASEYQTALSVAASGLRQRLSSELRELREALYQQKLLTQAGLAAAAIAPAPEVNHVEAQDASQAAHEPAGAEVRGEGRQASASQNRGPHGEHRVQAPSVHAFKGCPGAVGRTLCCEGRERYEPEVCHFKACDKPADAPCHKAQP